MLSLLKLKDKLYYGWIVVVAFLIMNAVLTGTRVSYGVFFKSLEGEFDLTRTETSAAYSLYLAFGILFSIVGGRALDRYGPRVVILFMGIFAGASFLLTSQVSNYWQMIITYSLFLAIGTNALNMVMTSTVSRWFDERRGLAMGIASSGMGLGTVIAPLFAAYLIINLDWRMAYLIIGAVVLVIMVPLSRVFKPGQFVTATSPNNEEPQSRASERERAGFGITESSLTQTARTKNFWLVMFIWFIFALTTFLVLTHIVPHATDIGYSAGKAALVLSVIGVGTIIGRVVLGGFSDKIGRKLTAIICSALHLAIMVWLIPSHALWILYLGAFLYGLFNGGMISSMAALIADTLGLNRIGAILGILDIGYYAGAAIGPVVGGFVFDTTGSYFFAFMFAALIMLIAAFLIVLIKPLHKVIR